MEKQLKEQVKKWESKDKQYQWVSITGAYLPLCYITFPPFHFGKRYEDVVWAIAYLKKYFTVPK